MKLRAALIAGKGPPGVFLLDENDEMQVSISLNGTGSGKVTRKTLEQIAATIAELIPEDGIEI